MKCKEEQEKRDQEKNNVTQISTLSTSNKSQPPTEERNNVAKTGDSDKGKKNTTFSSSIEGLSESDIKMKLIESAKIKSKISRQSFEEKVKKKVRRSNPDKHDEKASNKSKTGHIKSEASKHTDNVEETIKLEFIPGEEKTSRLENVTIEKQNKKASAASVGAEIKPEIEIFRRTSTHTQKVAPGLSCTIITGKPRADTLSSSSSSKLSTTIRPVPGSGARPLHNNHWEAQG